METRMIETKKYEALKNVILTLQAHINVGNVEADEDLVRDITICKEVLLEFMPYETIDQGMNDAIQSLINMEKDKV